MNSVLVTGAGRRIGATLARGLAADGWFVHLHCNRSTDEAAAVLDGIRAAGGDGAVTAADLSDADEAAALIGRLPAAAPPLRALVNSASLFAFDDLAGITADALDRHFHVNTRAPILLARALHAAVPRNAAGCVVNILDNKVWNPNPDFFSYTVSKLAIAGATRALALALAPTVRVCGVAPGITLISGDQSRESFEQGHRMNPLRRSSTPEDILRTVRFLLATPSITGEIVTIDGGQFLAPQPRDVAFLTDVS